MTTHQQQLQNPRYRDWVKGCLSFRYMRDGIQPFTVKTAKDVHTNLLQKLVISAGQMCNSGCLLTNLKPDHPSVPGRVPNCTLGQKNCNCLYTRGKQSCPNKICSRVYDEIVRNHVTQSPNWRNSDISKWCTDYWEIAKCFIHTNGYAGKTVSETDITGIFQVYTNNITFQSALGPLVTTISQIRDRRNELFHSATMELDEADLKTCLTDMIAVLNDVQISSHQDAQKAIKNLQELENEKFVISLKDETDIYKESIADIDKKVTELELTEQQIDKIVIELESKEQQIDKRVTELESKEQQNDKRVTELESKEQQNEKHITVLYERCAPVKRKLAQTQKDMDKIKVKVSRHEKKLAKHSKQLAEHGKEIDSLKKDVNELKNIRENRQEHLERLEDRRKLQGLFSEKYVKTSLTPLTASKDTDISRVYAPPNITREEEEKITEQSSEGKGKKKQLPVNSYEAIFNADGKRRKRVYLIGDVGSGKSAFCKMMMHTWCMSRDSVETEDQQQMKLFDYMFYLPLRLIHEENDLQQMVLKYYKMIPEERIRYIFRNMPEKCIILLDGLDEWQPMKSAIQREHETVGLPVCDDIKEVTIVTTSRPSARGILNMKTFDYDLKLTLNGIHDVNTFVQKYETKGDKSKENIISRLNGIKDIQKTPLLAQHIIWLLCRGEDVGNTESGIYSTLVNIAFRWITERNPEQEIHTGSSQQLDFPKQLIKKFPEFRKYKTILACLCRMAFEMYTTGSQLSFGEYELEDNGVNKQLLGQILHTGLLTKEIRYDPTAEKTQFSFTHLSFLEYFCALDISSHLTIQETTPPFPADTGPSASRDIFPLLQDRCRSVEDVLRLKTVLVMVCGLSPDKILAVCQLVYNIVQQDEHFLNLRKQACRYYVIEEEAWQYLEVAEHYQQLVFRCIREYKLSTSISEIRVPLLDVVIDGWTDNEAETVNMTERHIDHMTVRSLYIREKPDITLSTFVNLETIIMIDCRMSHAQSSSLAEYITRTVTLKNIQLHALSCSEYTCCHEIDLSRHEQLQRVRIDRTWNFRLNNINTTNLEYCCVYRPSGISFSSTESTKLQYIHIDRSSVHVSDIRLINQSLLLKHIELKNMELANRGLMDRLQRKFQLDLSRHDQLETFIFLYNKCLHVDRVNTSKLVHCETDSREVLSCVRNAAVLEKLELEYMQYNMEVHEILLTLPQLHTLNLDWVDMSRDVLDVIVNGKDKFLTKLTELYVYERPSISDVNRFVQTLPQLQKLTLRFMDMKDDVLEVSPGMKHLTHITLEDFRISSSCWIRFVDSLLTLQQSVTVEAGWLSRDIEARNAAADYIRKRPEKYRILKDESEYGNLNFVTAKADQAAENPGVNQ